MTAPVAPVLWGREQERAALDRLVSRVRSGHSGVLVLRGESGIGKTALLDDLCERSEGVRVLRAAGVESEAELAFAAAHHLCDQLAAGGIDRLPAPQRDALKVAFGLTVGEPPDPFLVGLAVLNWLADAAEPQPVLCLVDDAQWLDRASAQTLAFVARRLHAEGVAVVFTVREPSEQLAGLPELVIGGLARDDARALLGSVLLAPLDESVRERFIAETHGNPLALVELSRGLSAAELAGGFGLEDALRVSSRVEESFRRRIEALPAQTRSLLLIAAAEPAGDPVLLWRAARMQGIDASAADHAEAEGLLSLGARVVFRHPLVRSACYRLARADERRRAHRALVEATDPTVDPDRRAWHRAQAAAGPDEDIAAELERSADRVRARGGLAAAAAFLERAVALTPGLVRRGQRALAAAQTKFLAGDRAAALELLSIAGAGPLDDLELARAELLRARLERAVSRGSDAPARLIEAARRLEPLDARLARETYLDALAAALFAGRLARGADLFEAARAARAAPPVLGPPHAADVLLDGFAVLLTEGYPRGAPILKRAVSAFRTEELREHELRWLFLACHGAMITWDYEGWLALSTRQIKLARNAGALGYLPIALTMRIGAHLHAGELAAAASLVGELEAVTDATLTAWPPYAAVWLAAWYAREADAVELIDDGTQRVLARGEGNALGFIQWVTALRCNGLGRYEDAFAAAQAASEHPEEGWLAFWLHELVEAAARSGRDGRAAEALEELSQMARVSATDWALGIEARSRALLTGTEAAEELYREAIARLERTPLRIEHARAQLVLGEWLRRQGRRVDAREQLRLAHDTLESIGAATFAARAARELAATGERVRKRTPETIEQLTAQEAQIARLAAEGYSNREIGGQLFISHRTVGYHLRKVFTKLDIGNRTQLHAALGGAATAPRLQIPHR